MKWLALIPFLLFACDTSKNAQKDEWIGKSKQEVLMKEGVPEQTSNDGKGGEIMVYSHRRVVYETDRTYKASFFVDSAGLVYHVLYENFKTPTENMTIKIKN